MGIFLVFGVVEETEFYVVAAASADEACTLAGVPKPDPTKPWVRRCVELRSEPPGLLWSFKQGPTGKSSFLRGPR